MSTDAAPVERMTNRLPSWRLGKVRLSDAVRDMVDGAIKDDIMGLAAEVTYRTTLTVFPFLLIVVSLPWLVSSLFSVPDAGDAISRQLGNYLSQSSADLVKALIVETSRSTGWHAFLLGLIGTLWAGTSTTSSIRKCLNRVYRFDDQEPFLRRKWKEFWLTGVMGALLLAAVLSVLLGPALLGRVPIVSVAVADLAAFVLIMIAVSLLFWQGVSEPHGFELATPGAAFFAVTWLAFSIGFAAYLSRVGTMNHVYGSLGAMIALLFWLNGSSLALLLAAELNAAIARRVDPAVEASRQPKTDL